VGERCIVATEGRGGSKEGWLGGRSPETK
jgi:hypothetical protein